MLKRNKKIISHIMSLSIVFSTVNLPSFKALAIENNENFIMTRLSGDNRYETSAKISENGWVKADYVIIVNGENFSDALCASPLAKKYDAPILLTSKDSLDEKVLSEIVRLGAKKAFIIGRSEDVSETIVNEMKEKGINDIERICGSNKYDTSVKIAEKMGQVDKVVVASSENLADALSIASIAAYKGMPILLTASNKLEDEVNKYITSKKITSSYVVGGASAVSDEVKAKLPAAERIWGQDRYETNRNVISKFADMDFSNLYFAQGEIGFADALAGSALAAKNGSPIVLTSDTLNEESKKLVKANMRTDSKVTLLGGEKLIEASTLSGVEGFKNYDKDGTVYGEDGKVTELNENIKIIGKNVALKNIKTPYSVSIKGDNATLVNAEIGGTLYLDPGEKGTSNIKNIKAKKVVILSGAKESNHADNLTTDDLVIKSKNPNNNPRFELKGKSSIKNMIVQTCAILDIKEGNIGKLTVNSDAEISADKIAVVNKIEIATENKDSKVVLNGNFGDVEVNRAAKVVVASGNTDIKANVKTDIDVSKGANVAIKGDASNAIVKGEGKVQTGGSVAQTTTNTPAASGGGASGGSSGGGASSGGSSGGSTGGSGKSGSQNNSTKSSEKNIISKIFKTKNPDSYPANITAEELLNGITVSENAAKKVLDIDGKEVSASTIITRGMKIRVTAQDGTYKDNPIKFDLHRWNLSNEIDKNNCRDRIKNLELNDENNEKMNVSGKIKFIGLKDETVISKYYYEFKQEGVESKVISAGYIEKNTSKIYSHNINFTNTGFMTLSIFSVYNDSTLTNISQIQIYDNPIVTNKPSIEEIKIYDFNDLNYDGGKIVGDLSFTKAKDEADIDLYEAIVVANTTILGKTFVSGYWNYYIPANGSKDYSIKKEEFIIENIIDENVEGYEGVNFTAYVMPINKDGIAASGELRKNHFDKENHRDFVKIELNDAVENHLNGIKIINPNSLEAQYTGEFITVPNSIRVKELDSEGNETGDNLVNLSQCSISKDNKHILEIKLTQKIYSDKNYKVTLGKYGSVTFNGVADRQNAPYVVSTNSINEKTVEVRFNKELNSITASNVSNYKIDGSIGTPIGAVYNNENKSVILKTTEQIPNKKYIITINGVQDLDGNEIMNAEAPFVTLRTSMDITIPKFISSKKIDDKTIEVCFSESIKIQDNLTINNTTGSAIAVANIDKNDDKILILKSVNLTGFGTETIKVNFYLYVKDLSNNPTEDEIIEIK